MKILLIEDDPDTAGYVANGLRENSHLVEHAANGRDGLFLASGGGHDVMVIDRMLPGVDEWTCKRCLPKFETRIVAAGAERPKQLQAVAAVEAMRPRVVLAGGLFVPIEDPTFHALTEKESKVVEVGRGKCFNCASKFNVFCNPRRCTKCCKVVCTRCTEGFAGLGFVIVPAVEGKRGQEPGCQGQRSDSHETVVEEEVRQAVEGGQPAENPERQPAPGRASLPHFDQHDVHDGPCAGRATDSGAESGGTAAC